MDSNLQAQGAHGVLLQPASLDTSDSSIKECEDISAATVGVPKAKQS